MKPRAATADATRAACRGAARACLVGWLLASVGNVAAQTRHLPASAPQQAPCVQVRIGNDEAGRWSCINQAMKQEVEKVAPVLNTDTPADRSTPIGLGVPTPGALRQRMGDQYGKSLQPQRPPRQFGTPLPPPVR